MILLFFKYDYKIKSYKIEIAISTGNSGANLLSGISKYLIASFFLLF